MQELRELSTILFGPIDRLLGPSSPVGKIGSQYRHYAFLYGLIVLVLGALLALVGWAVSAWAAIAAAAMICLAFVCLRLAWILRPALRLLAENPAALAELRGRLAELEGLHSRVRSLEGARAAAIHLARVVQLARVAARLRAVAADAPPPEDREGYRRQLESVQASGDMVGSRCEAVLDEYLATLAAQAQAVGETEQAAFLVARGVPDHVQRKLGPLQKALFERGDPAARFAALEGVEHLLRELARAYDTWADHEIDEWMRLAEQG